MRTLTLVFVGLVTTSGCASIRGGAVRDVKLTSNPPGAAVTVSDRGGNVVFAGATPTVARLKAGAGYFRPAQYTVKFERAGYAPYAIPTRAHVDWFLYVVGNIPLLVVPGVVWVDPSTGAMWSFEREMHAELVAQPAGR